MNKLAKKFCIGIVGVLFVSTICSAFLNQQFVETYYLYKKRNTLENIETNLLDKLSQGMNIDDAIATLESEYRVLIVYTDNNISDNDMINNEIREGFQRKGVGFQKFWLWENDYQDILGGKNKVRLYQQENLNYSILVEYVSYDEKLLSIATIVPNITDAFGIINTFSLGISILTIMGAMIVIIILIKKITAPLKLFEKFATDMGKQTFLPLEVHTKDELEDVADNLNAMGNQIVSYQTSLEDKNIQMEQLLNDVAHDLKTPVSLIKLYANGIQDGLDDGTFLTTILQSNDQMEKMIHNLLLLTRIDQEEFIMESCNSSALLSNLLQEYAVLAKKQQVIFVQDIVGDIWIETNKEWLSSIFTNLLTNAIKYTSAKEILVSLSQSESYVEFTIANECDNSNLDIVKIWDPYYVGEASRNKLLSGTGLGLPMVLKFTKRLHYQITCSFENNIITFHMKIPVLEKKIKP